MIEFRIEHNAGQVAELSRRAPDRVEVALGRAFSRAAHELARKAKRRAPKAHSHLVNSIIVTRLGRVDYLIGSGMDYAYMVHEGTGSGGNPPRQVLLDWIRVKGITPNNPDMSMDDLAFLIGRSIRGKGTPAQPFLRDALEAHRPRIEELVEREIKTEIDRL